MFLSARFLDHTDYSPDGSGTHVVLGGGSRVPRHWHVAEIDDGGALVRLAAAPRDLARIVRALDGADLRVRH